MQTIKGQRNSIPRQDSGKEECVATTAACRSNEITSSGDLDLVCTFTYRSDRSTRTIYHIALHQCAPCSRAKHFALQYLFLFVRLFVCASRKIVVRGCCGYYCFCRQSLVLTSFPNAKEKTLGRYINTSNSKQCLCSALLTAYCIWCCYCRCWTIYPFPG